MMAAPAIAPAGGAAAPRGQKLQQLRRTSTVYIIVYYWLATGFAVLAAALLGVPAANVALPLGAIGAWATLVALRAPDSLSTRLTITVAINATWMFGLYIASDLHGGNYMLEVHMLYFINTAVILSYACWRSVLMTTVAALAHHLLLSLLQPGFVWPDADHTWVHFANHSVLGAMNCAGGILIAVAIERFLTDLERLAEASENRALHDDLTGLLNRRGLRAWVERTRQGAPQGLTVLQIDLDGFKQINDTVGHLAGDQLLVMVAEKLRALAPEGAAVSRIGGDEFVVAVPGVHLPDGPRLLDAFFDWTRRPCTLNGQMVRFGASMGITSSIESGDDFDTMLVDADIALYAAKTAGKNRRWRFDASLRERTVEAKALADDLIRGLEDDEFVPFFQTQHDARSGALVGVEALVRWRHPRRGVLPPAAFLDAAGAAGLIAEIDGRVLVRAVDAVREMEAGGMVIPKLAVNISSARLIEPDLVRQVGALPPMQAGLAFEIVESVYFDELSDQDSWTLDRLRDRGVTLEIDDFGTGHASIVALTRLAPEALKIDRRLIAPLAESSSHVGLVRAIVDIARSLNIRTIAEGVETEAEAQILRTMGVSTLQGYLFGKPVPVEQLREALQRVAA